MLFHAPISTWPFFSPGIVLQDTFEVFKSIQKATYPLYSSGLAKVDDARYTRQHAWVECRVRESTVTEQPTEQHSLNPSATSTTPHHCQSESCRDSRSFRTFSSRGTRQRRLLLHSPFDLRGTIETLQCDVPAASDDHRWQPALCSSLWIGAQLRERNVVAGMLLQSALRQVMRIVAQSFGVVTTDVRLDLSRFWGNAYT